MTPYQDDDEDKDLKTTPPTDVAPAGNPGFFSKLLQANNDAYQSRKKAASDDNAIALDKINMDINPDLPGPRQDAGTMLPATRQNLTENIMPMAAVGSLGSGGGKTEIAQRIQNLSEEAPITPITTQRIQDAMDMAKQIQARPGLAQTPKAQLLMQRLNTMIKKGRTRGVSIPGEE